MKEENKHIRLTTAFFYDTAIEPEVINLKETTVAIGIPGFLSGYFGNYAQTKGYKPIKVIADELGKRYTIIDYTITATDFEDGREIPSGMKINLKQLTKSRLKMICEEIFAENAVLHEKIQIHGGVEKALIDNPLFLSDMLPYLGRYKESVIIHTIKPNVSPALAVASIAIEQMSNRVVNASCRFNRETRVIW